MTREIDVTGIDNIDWEAIVEDPNGGLLIGDIGDYWDGALQYRSDFKLISVAEPDPVTGTSVGVDAIYPFHFPGNVAYNAEAMFTVEDWIYLITKDTQQVWRFPETLSTVDNELILIGDVGGNAPLEIITGADVSDDYTRAALTLDLKRMVIFERPAGATPTTAAQADAVVTELLVGQDPTWQRYYRRAGMWESQGVLDQLAALYDDPMEIQTTMQVEGAAFRNGSYDIASISEYGRHVLFTTQGEYQANSAPLAVEPATVNGTSLQSQGYASDPVNIATGNFTDTWTDLDFGAADPYLGFGRTYNSLDTSDGPLSQGWSVHYSDHLDEDGDDVDLVTSEGRLVRFVSDGAGGWDQPDEFVGVLTDDGDGSYSIVYPDDTVWDFDTDGLLESVQDWAGDGVTIARDVNDRVDTVTSTTGRTVEFTYNGAGHITQVEGSDGRTVTYTYTGGLLSGIDTGATTWSFINDAEGRIEEIRDGENRLVVANVYDQEARVIEQTVNTGELVWFSYDDNYGVTTMTDGATGDVTVYSHDAGGRLVDVQDAAMANLQRSYDDSGNLATETDREGVTTTYDWSPEGLIEAVAGPDGTATYTYDSLNRPVTLERVDGETTEFTYTGNSRVPDTIQQADGQQWDLVHSGDLVTSTTDPTGVTTTYTYDAAGQLLSVNDPAVGITTYTYDSSGRVITETQASGLTMSWTYDDDGRILTETTNQTGTTTYTYNDAGDVLTITGPNGGITTNTYNAAGLLASTTDPEGGVTAYTYNGAGEVLTVTDPEGGVTTTTYGPLGRVLTVTDPDGGVTAFTYDLNGQVATQTDPEGGVTSFTYDTAGRQVTATDPEGGITTNAYDDLGRVVSVDDPTGRATGYVYDDVGQVTAMTDPAGNATTYTYDTAGRLLSETDPEGGVTTYGYDTAGRQITVTDPTAKTTTTTYDTAGRVATVADPAGGVTTTTYDTAGRVAAVTDPAGGITTTTYDTAGRVATVTDPGGGVTTYAYDLLDRVVAVTDPTGAVTETTYDAAGRAVAFADANDNVTTTTYDDAGRPIATVDPTGSTTTTTYDDAGRPVSVTDPLGNATTYAYDDAGRLIAETVPTGASIVTTYDAAGRVLTRTDLAGGITTMTYDSAGRVATLTDPNNNTTTHTYDDAGRLLGRAFADSTTVAYTYDAAGRRLTMIDATGTTTYTYDTAGRPDQITDADGLTIGYDWTARGETSQITYPDASTASYTWNPTGALASVAHADVGTIGYTYDLAQRPTAVSLPGSETRTMTWDRAGNLTGFTQSLDSGANNATATFDAADRLATLTAAASTTTYTYDAAGQLTEAAATGNTFAYTYDLGRPATTTTPTLTQTWEHDNASRITDHTAQAVTPTELTVHVIVGNAGSPDAGDVTLIDHLENTLGYTVEVIDDGAPEDVAGADLVIITQSVGSTQTTGNYTDEAIPVLTLATHTWDEHGLVDNQAGSYPYATSTAIAVVDPTHPAVAGISGATTSADAPIGYALAADIPADAHLVANPKTGQTDRGALIVFDTGDLDANNTPTPDRRALLGYHRNAFATLTSNGWATLNQTINWLVTPPPAPPEPTAGTVHVIVGNAGSPDAGDVTLIDHLENTLGYTVNVIDDGAPEDVAGADLVIITQSVGSTQTTGNYTDEAIPVLTLATHTWDEHGLVDNQAGSYPYATSTAIAVTDPTHPTVAGISGATTTADVPIGYALAADIPADAHLVANPKTGQPDRGALIVFDTGDLDANNTPTPDRRALLGYHRNAFATLTTNGWATLNQTINWLRTEPAYDPTSRLTQLDNTTITYNARGLPDTITTTDPAGTTTQTRDYNGDGLLTDITITEPDTTTTTHHLTWNTLQPVPQILAITTNGQTTNYLYGNQREALINPDNTTALFAHDHHGNTLTTPATTNHTTATDFDPYGNPTNGPDPTRIGFGYQGELHIGPTIHLRNRDYLPQHQTFTTTDPLANVPGTPTTSNPYHYANNTPTNLNDPLGLRPTDRTFEVRRAKPQLPEIPARLALVSGVNDEFKSAIVFTAAQIEENADHPAVRGINGFLNPSTWRIAYWGICPACHFNDLRVAAEHALDIANLFRAGGAWDIKQFFPTRTPLNLGDRTFGIRNDVFGNIHYGAVMRATGISQRRANQIAALGTWEVCFGGRCTEPLRFIFGGESEMDPVFVRLGYRVATSSPIATIASLTVELAGEIQRWRIMSTRRDDNAVIRCKPGGARCT
ncbi:MAG: DUF6531 domain-containing protein [Acidimicrobiales bacterium]